MSISFDRLAVPDWALLDRCADRTLFQTKSWLDFVAEAQGADPCHLAIRRDSQIVGYFTGMIVKKLGFKILGAPFPGWSTQYLGFNLTEEIDRTALLEPLSRFVFNELGCWHLELMDRWIGPQDIASLRWEHRLVNNTEIDLSGSEEQILANMKGSCRTSIRKAEKSGVVVESASDPEFADDFYSQLTEVFGKQGLKPTYGVTRVRLLMKHLLPTGNLLMVRARDANGDCIATGIYPAYNRTMYFWGGASYRRFQILQPNEAVQWFAMRYWKDRGITACDMGGGGEYKTKYGGKPLNLPWSRKSRIGLIGSGRKWAQKSHTMLRRVTGRLSVRTLL